MDLAACCPLMLLNVKTKLVLKFFFVEIFSQKVENSQNLQNLRPVKM